MQSTSNSCWPVRWSTPFSSLSEKQKELICKAISPAITEIALSKIFEYDINSYNLLKNSENNAIITAEAFFKIEASKPDTRMLTHLFLAINGIKERDTILSNLLDFLAHNQ